MSEQRSWAGEAGLPSRHIAEAALHVAAVIDASGSHAVDATESYWHRATGGRFPPAALARGQDLLLDTGLLIDDAGVLRPTAALADLVTGSPGDALATLGRRILDATPTPRPVPSSMRSPISFRMLIAGKSCFFSSRSALTTRRA